MDLSYFEQKFENFVCVHNLNVSKTKPVGTRGHPLLLILFFQNKGCMHNEEGNCTEIFPSFAPRYAPFVIWRSAFLIVSTYLIELVHDE